MKDQRILQCKPILGFLGLLLWGAGWTLLPGCSTDEPVEVFGPTPYTIAVPAGWPAMPIPADNPTTVEGIELGRMLFFDPILSGDSTQACADCHVQADAFSDTRRFSIGIDGLPGTRNAPPIFNAGWIEGLFWDGRAPQLEDQALQPVPNPIEMHLEWDEAEIRLNRHPGYPEKFDFVFGPGPVTRDKVAKAIAQFERTLVSAGSDFDRWKRGEIPSLGESAQRGWVLFFTETGDCFHCHGEPFFTDHDFHNNGIDSVIIDIGLEEVTGDPNDRGKFRVPSLRNIEVTAPYMVDGRFQTLEEVLDHYNSGGHFTTSVDPLIRPLGLTDLQKADLIAFLKTLTDPDFLTNPDFSNPFE